MPRPRTCFVLIALIGTASLFSGCARERAQEPTGSDPAIVGTWIKFGSPKRMMKLAFTEDNSFQIDYTGDAQMDVSGQYSISDGQITLMDQKGSQVCPDPGLYRYKVRKNQLTLSVMQDGCEGRARPAVGEWTQEGALEECTKAIQANPEDVAAYMNRAHIRFVFLDPQGAFEDYQKAIALKPDHAEAYAGRAKVRSVFWKDYPAAIADFDKVLELDPEDAEAYFDRGLARFYSDDRNGACQDWSTSFQLGFAQAQEILSRYCQ